MPKKGEKMSDELKAKLAAGREAKKNKNPETNKDEATPVGVTTPVLPPVSIESPAEESNESTDDLKRQIAEMKTNQDLMMMLLKGGQGQGISVGNSGKLIGEVEKYTVDPENYADPTIRLRKEPRLAPLAFDYNYELDYEMSVRPYETKMGVNQKEPEFLITLNRIVLADDGSQTNKRYIAKRMVFHEDPQAAIVIARDNGVELDEFKDLDNTTDNQKLFLNEMRYLRVRDWLFGVFWPTAATQKKSITEEVIGGSIVQVFTKNSEEPSGVDFDKIKTILR